MNQSLRQTGIAGFCLAVVLSGCHGRSKDAAAPYRRSPSLSRLSIAVAPAVNLSGSSDFDPARIADLMANELGHMDGISVIPVSRVLGVLAAQGLDRVGSPEHAGELGRWLGADAVLVFAVTHYDPYDPPTIGISAQLFGQRRIAGDAGAAPGRSGEQGGTLAYMPEDGRRDEAGVELLAQVQRVYSAAHDEVVNEVRRFAAARDSDNSAYGWRKYVVSQVGFIQFCCYTTVRRLLEDPGTQQMTSMRTNGEEKRN